MVAQIKTAAKPIPFIREFPILGSILQFMGDRLAFQLLPNPTYEASN